MCVLIYCAPGSALINDITDGEPSSQYTPVFLITVINVPADTGWVNLICLEIPLTEKSASNCTSPAGLSGPTFIL